MPILDSFDAILKNFVWPLHIFDLAAAPVKDYPSSFFLIATVVYSGSSNTIFVVFQKFFNVTYKAYSHSVFYLSVCQIC